MKFCLIGCGGIVQSMHAPAYRLYASLHPDFIPAACCDRMAERVESVQKIAGFKRVYRDHMEMLQTEKPDAAAVIVSEEAAAAVGMDVLRLGIPMLIEKPPGRTSAETLMLSKEAQERGVPCQVAFNRRFMPVLTAMRGYADRDIQLITYDMVRHERKDRHFADTAVHAIDAVRYLAGSDYTLVRFIYHEMPAYGEGVCNILIDADMASGAKARITVCPVSGVSLERAGIHMRGKLLLGYTPAWGGCDSPGRIETFTEGGPPEKTVFEPAEVFVSNGFYAENEAFFSAVKAGKQPSPAIREAVNTMRVKECIDERLPECRLDGSGR